MTRRKLENRNTRTLGRTGSGRSLSVTLPIEIMRELRWRAKQKVVVTRKGSKVIIEDWPVKK